jgi:predicted acylesterase/phospholipase RssA
MNPSHPVEAKQFRIERSRFEQTVLLLQGGGALGSYKAGVYQGLAEANLHLDWVAGISIGAVNAALIAGNPPEKRVEKLREFWEAVSGGTLGRRLRGCRSRHFPPRGHATSGQDGRRSHLRLGPLQAGITSAAHVAPIGVRYR